MKIVPESINEWNADCLHWRDIKLTGEYSHWRPEWDYLPIDETCVNEWPCGCVFHKEEMKIEKNLST